MHPTRFVRSILVSAVAVLGFASPLFAADWTDVGLPAGYQYALARGPAGELYACGGGAVHRSLDGGLTWSTGVAFGSFTFPHVLACAPSGALFAGDIAHGVYRSLDGGQSWSPSLTPEGCDGLAVHPGGVLVAGLTYSGLGQIHRSPDAGASWLGVGLPGTEGNSSARCFAFGAAGEIYAGTLEGVFRSDDEGTSWQSTRSGLLGRQVRVIANTPTQHLFVLTTYPSLFDGLYRSTDGAASWQRIGAAPYFSALISGPDGTLYGASDEKVHVSTDEGANWVDASDGITPYEQLASLVLTADGHLLAGGNRVWRHGAAVTGVDAAADRAAGPRLMPVAPNPIVDRAQVSFELARAGRAELSVYDVAGRRVATLSDGLRSAGRHELAWDLRDADGTRVGPGAYFAVLRVEDQRLVRRCVVVR